MNEPALKKRNIEPAATLLPDNKNHYNFNNNNHNGPTIQTLEHNHHFPMSDSAIPNLQELCILSINKHPTALQPKLLSRHPPTEIINAEELKINFGGKTFSEPQARLSIPNYFSQISESLWNTLFYFLKEHCLKKQELKQLSFENCAVSDNILQAAASFPSLEYLDLSYVSRITPISLYYLSHLNSLSTLILDHCPPSVPYGLPFFVHNLAENSFPSLRKLSLAFCEIQDPALIFFEKFKLESLDLTGNRIADQGCKILSSLSSLENLNLSMNSLITDTGLQYFSAHKSLKNLSVNFCKNITENAIIFLQSKRLSVQDQACPVSLPTEHSPLALLAEDNKIQARMISLVLSRYNFQVEIAPNGKEALERYKKNPKYDIILMDVYMPFMDGITCVKQIREYEEAHNIKRVPIIIQTCDVNEMSNSCLQAGCDEVLSKPLDKTCIELAKYLISGRKN